MPNPLCIHGPTSSLLYLLRTLSLSVWCASGMSVFPHLNLLYEYPNCVRGSRFEAEIFQVSFFVLYAQCSFPLHRQKRGLKRRKDGKEDRKTPPKIPQRVEIVQRRRCIPAPPHEVYAEAAVSFFDLGR